MSDVIDLGDGMTVFKLEDGRVFRLSVVDFSEWMSRWKAPPDAGPYAFLHAVAGKVKELAGVELNLSQAEALLRGVEVATDAAAKKHAETLSSLRSTGST